MLYTGPHRTAHKDQDTGPGWTATRTGTDQIQRTRSDHRTRPHRWQGQMTGTEGYRAGYNAVHRYKSKVIAWQNRCKSKVIALQNRYRYRCNRTRYRDPDTGTGYRTRWHDRAQQMWVRQTTGAGTDITIHSYRYRYIWQQQQTTAPGKTPNIWQEHNHS